MLGKKENEKKGIFKTEYDTTDSFSLYTEVRDGNNTRRQTERNELVNVRFVSLSF